MKGSNSSHVNFFVLVLLKMWATIISSLYIYNFTQVATGIIWITCLLLLLSAAKCMPADFGLSFQFGLIWKKKSSVRKCRRCRHEWILIAFFLVFLSVLICDFSLRTQCYFVPSRISVPWSEGGRIPLALSVVSANFDPRSSYRHISLHRAQYS